MLPQTTCFVEKCEGSVITIVSIHPASRNELTCKMASTLSSISQSKSDNFHFAWSAILILKYMLIAYVKHQFIEMMSCQNELTGWRSCKWRTIMYTESHLIFTSLKGYSTGTWTGAYTLVSFFAVNQLHSLPSSMNAQKPSCLYCRDVKKVRTSVPFVHCMSKNSCSRLF